MGDPSNRRVVRLARWLLRRRGPGTDAERRAELRDLVAGETQLGGEERRLIDEVLTAGDRQLREVMVPRTRVTFLDAGLTVSRAVRLVRAAPHSRFPVMDGDPDAVVGFVHLRDLLVRPYEDPTQTVGALAREITRLPGSKRVLPALSEMRRGGSHLAVVIDEYGGTAGIVTLEDLIEELVGEIHDEYDVQPPAVTGAHDGLLNLADFAERTGVTLAAGPYETVGGFVMAALGRIPEVGDEVCVGEWRLTVAALDGRRIARVVLSKVPLPTLTAAVGHD